MVIAAAAGWGAESGGTGGMMHRFSRARWLASAGAFAGTALIPRIALSDVTTLRIGTGTVEANAEVYFAQELGLFKKAGLDVTIVPLRSGTTIAAAMLAGDLQYGVSNVLSLAVAHLRDVPFVIIAPAGMWDTGNPIEMVVVAPNATIASGKDLTGKIVGGISLGGLDELAMRAYIDKGGGDWTQVKFVEVPPSAMAEALAQGRIAAAELPAPELTVALAAKTVKGIAGGYDAISKQFLNTAWFGMREFVAKNPDTTRKVAGALIAGGEWAMANQVAAAGLVGKYLNFKEDRMTTRFGTKLDAAAIQPCFDAASKYKLLSAPVSAADMVWSGR
jgi:NitT/TauT family transport system substrate-binding protein